MLNDYARAQIRALMEERKNEMILRNTGRVSHLTLAEIQQRSKLLKTGLKHDALDQDEGR